MNFEIELLVNMSSFKTHINLFLKQSCTLGHIIHVRDRGKSGYTQRKINNSTVKEKLRNLSGIFRMLLDLVIRGMEGKIASIKYVRETE